MMTFAFTIVAWALFLAILGAYFWVVSWLPMLVLFLGGPLVPPTVVTWLELPIARLVCASAACVYMLWSDAFFVWPRRAAELLRKSGF